MLVLSKKDALRVIEKSYSQKNKRVNAICETMINNILLDSDTITVEPTRSNHGVNRGSLVECLIKAYVKHFINGDMTPQNFEKSQAYESDIIIDGKAYEIKLSTNYSSASPMTTQDDLILVNENGVYYVPYNKVQFNKQRRVCRVQPFGQKLVKMSKALGF